MTPADRARLECQRQGIPFAITDRATIAAIVAVLNQQAAGAPSAMESPPAAALDGYGRSSAHRSDR
jgi:hypothetical protein